MLRDGIEKEVSSKIVELTKYRDYKPKQVLFRISEEMD